MFCCGSKAKVKKKNLNLIKENIFASVAHVRKKKKNYAILNSSQNKIHTILDNFLCL